MDGLIKCLAAAGMILLAFVVAFLLVIGLYFIKPYVTSREPKHSLELNEIVVRSREIINSYWQRHQGCPSANDLTTIKQLPRVEQIKMNVVGDRQCLLTIKVIAHDGVPRTIKQHISFTKLDEPSINYSCYHNSVTQEMPNKCATARDIDAISSKE